MPRRWTSLREDSRDLKEPALGLLQDKTILIIGTELWGSIFVSKHYIAKYLAEAGNRVFYLNPVCIPWSVKSLWRLPIRFKETQTRGLTVISYGNPFPKLASLPLFIQRFMFRYLAWTIRHHISDNIDLVWSFDLTRFPELNCWRPSTTLLHLVELFDHPHFQESQPFRQEVLMSADHVITIADLITDQVSQQRPDAHQLFHGADIDGFKTTPNLAAIGRQLPGNGRLKAGFVGNFQFSFDFKLLGTLAEANPDVDFILIGPREESSNLGKLDPKVSEAIQKVESSPNIYFLGPVPSDQVMAYLVELDINLILYDQAFWQGHCNPHKMMAYFYAGKPILASYIHQYRNSPDLVKTTKTKEEFLAAFEQIKSEINKDTFRQNSLQRREFALGHSYTRLLKEIERKISPLE